MKNPSQPPKIAQKTSLTLKRFYPYLATILGFAAVIVLWLSWYSYNTAENTLSPIEKSLVKVTNATKLCKGGSPGKGPDSSTPYFRAYYEVPMARQKTVDTLGTILKEQGFSFAHANPQDRGHLGVADIYIDRWYFGTSNRQVDLFTKKMVQLSVVVEPNAESPCQDGKHSTQNSTIIGVEIVIP